MSKKPTPIKSKAVLSMVPATAPPTMEVAGPSDAPTPVKDKCKGHALPSPYIDEVPADILSFKGDPYGYSLSFDNDKFSDSDYTANEAHVSTSDMATCVCVILSGTMPTGNSGSSKRGGKELAVLCPDA